VSRFARREPYFGGSKVISPMPLVYHFPASSDLKPSLAR
jgi:hypothetical protein